MHHHWRCSGPLLSDIRKGCSVPGLSRLNCSFLTSRHQEDLKKTKELQYLKEEEEELKSEGPEEPKEADGTEEEGKDQKSRSEPLPLPNWVTMH